MRKITETKIILNEEETKLIKDICNFWHDLDNEFSVSSSIGGSEFISFLVDVVTNAKYTTLEGKNVKIIRFDDDSETEEEKKETYKRGYENGYKIGLDEGYDEGYETGYYDAITGY